MHIKTINNGSKELYNWRQYQVIYKMIKDKDYVIIIQVFLHGIGEYDKDASIAYISMPMKQSDLNWIEYIVMCTSSQMSILG